MPIYKVKEDDTDLRRNMEEYLIINLNPTSIPKVGINAWR